MISSALHSSHRAVRALVAVSSLGLAVALTGCSGFTSTASAPAITTASFGGSIHGGQQPVAGARVYVYAGGNTGYASPSRSLLNGGSGGAVNDQYGNAYVTTNASGGFTFSGFGCPTPNTPVYLLAVGGNPGLGGSANNNAITEAAAIGACSTITNSTFIQMTEVTTAAFVTAVQQYASGPTVVGAPASNQLGLRTAFQLALDLADSTTGLGRTMNAAGTGIVNGPKVNTLGNILAPCINSTSNVSSACTSLFQATPSTGGAPNPSETFTAMLNLAKNPGNNVGSLFGQINAAAPFQPSLTAAPNDFTLGITYSGGGMTAPGAIAIDALGDAFITNSPSLSGQSGTDSIVEIGPNGMFLASYTSNIHGPRGIAIDVAGNIWSNNLGNANNTNDQVVKLNNQGVLVFATSATSVVLNGLTGIATDGNLSAWVAASPNGTTNANQSSISKIGPNGAILQPITMNGFGQPQGIAIDGNSNIYSAGFSSNNLLKITPTPANNPTSYPATIVSGNFSQPLGVAIDNANNVYSFNNGTSLITEISSAGVMQPMGNPAPNISNSAVISIDGAGGGWLANIRSSNSTPQPDNLVHFTTGGVAANGQTSGYQNVNLNRVGVATVDNIGNVWVSNNGSGTVTEFVGTAAPVVTPIAAGILNQTIGTRP